MGLPKEATPGRERLYRGPKIVSKYLVKTGGLPGDLAVAIATGTLSSSLTEHGYTEGGLGDRITRRTATDGSVKYFQTQKTVKQIENPPPGVGATVKTHTEIDRDTFERLWAETEGHRVIKRGYDITTFVQGPTTYLDIWQGPQVDGRVLINVEFASLADADQFEPPEWYGPNKTSEISSRKLAQGGTSVSVLNDSAQLIVNP